MTSERGLMSKSHALEGSDQRNDEHVLWLAMQAAYTKYRNASADLLDVATQPSGAIPSAEEKPWIETATSEQRAAFESYIEARMQYAEFCCDQNNARTRSLPCAKPENSTGHSEEKSPGGCSAGFTISRPALASAVFVLLGLGALTSANVIREQELVRDARMARNELDATLIQTQSDLQVLEQKLDALNVTQQFAIRASASAQAAPVRLQRAPVTIGAERKPTGKERLRSIQMPFSATQKRSKAAGNQENLIHRVHNLGGRSYWTFTLPVSRQFEVVGPVRLSLRSVNLKNKHFDLCVTDDDFKLDHVHLREPVLMALSDPSRRVELVATRVEKNHVQGYLSELQYHKSELTASHARRRPTGGS